MIPGLCALLYREGGGSSGGLSVTASPSSNYVLGAGTIVAGPITAAPNGGTPAYTYLWSQVGGDPSFSITTPTAASTTFAASGVSGNYLTGFFECVVTDSAARTATSNQITVNLEWA